MDTFDASRPDVIDSERERELIARAREDIAAGKVVTAKTVRAWVASLETSNPQSAPTAS